MPDLDDPPLYNPVPKGIGLTSLPVITCPYCWRDYMCGGNTDLAQFSYYDVFKVDLFSTCKT